MRNLSCAACALAAIALALTTAESDAAAPTTGRRAQAWGQAQAAASGGPRFSHVLVIVIENKEFSQVIGNPAMPNFNRWAKQYALLTRYHAVTHPSLPNYLALIGGDFFGIRDDCTDCRVDGPSLPALLEASGRTWKAYLEGLPSPGFTGASSGKYRKKHNPFAYFNALLKDPARLKRNTVALSALPSDLEMDRLPDFAFIMPDICNSSHDCSLEVTDAWLGRTVGAILGSPAYDASTLLVLTFDEGTTNLGCCGSPATAGGGRVATVLISALVTPGYQDPTPYSHYSLLKTILVAWGLELIGHTADPDVGLILEPWLQR
jgi:phosphatidylinositol-3-phosphatase